jgi:hypothetical protein
MRMRMRMRMRMSMMFTMSSRTLFYQIKASQIEKSYYIIEQNKDQKVKSKISVVNGQQLYPWKYDLHSTDLHSYFP